jgi:urease accessory protein
LTDQLILQLADSAFPSGGFAHSLGLEALRGLGLLRGEPALVLRLHELAWQTAYGVLPFLDHARDDAAGADRLCDRFLSNHVANRASRAQGGAFLIAAGAMLDARLVLPCGHLPVALGAVLAGAHVAVDDARRLAMFTAMRSATSAALRLSVIGPLRAQRVLLEAAPVAERALTETRGLRACDARSIAPLLDLAQAAHDRLYTRLFQS